MEITIYQRPIAWVRRIPDYERDSWLITLGNNNRRRKVQEISILEARKKEIINSYYEYREKEKEKTLIYLSQEKRRLEEFISSKGYVCRCGTKMVLRKAGVSQNGVSYGAFWGCPNYSSNSVSFHNTVPADEFHEFKKRQRKEEAKTMLSEITKKIGRDEDLATFGSVASTVRDKLRLAGKVRLGTMYMWLSEVMGIEMDEEARQKTSSLSEANRLSRTEEKHFLETLTAAFTRVLYQPAFEYLLEKETRKKRVMFDYICLSDEMPNDVFIVEMKRSEVNLDNKIHNVYRPILEKAIADKRENKEVRCLPVVYNVLSREAGDNSTQFVSFAEITRQQNVASYMLSASRRIKPINAYSSYEGSLSSPEGLRSWR